jgi:riboflavin synthase
MFTGIIEAIGRIESIITEKGNLVLEVSCPFEPRLGESITVDGVCLTVKDRRKIGTLPASGGVPVFRFLADAVAETVTLTTLKRRRRGDEVNLERALQASDRLGGHIVAGHIDETGKVLNIRTLPGARVFELGVSEPGSRLVVDKGSIAIDGISLTVAEVHGARVSVNVIPFTVEHTTLKNRRIGDDVNIEFDLIGKYVARLLPAHR